MHYHDSVLGDGSFHLLDIDFERHWINRNSDELDLKVVGGLHKGSMNSVRHNPIKYNGIRTDMLIHSVYIYISG